MIEFLQPPEDPTNYEARTYMSHGRLIRIPETPRYQRRDWAIRSLVEKAVQYNDEEVGEITKLIKEEYICLHKVDLTRPFRLPSKSCSVQPGGLDDGTGTDNKVLRDFVFDTYDKLDEFFIDQDWSNWIIAPFYEDSDETTRSFNLGGFVGKNISKTVVE